MMQVQRFFRSNRWVNGALALLLTLSLGLGLAQPAWAAASGQTQVVDSAGEVGVYTSLVLDSSGNPVISYYDNTNYDLKLVRCGNATCSSGNTIQTLDSTGSVGLYTSLALDSSGNPVVSYYDGSNADLKLVRCGNPTCSSGNTIVRVDSAGIVGRFNSLALDGSGNPVISYADYGNGDLKLVKCGNGVCSNGNSIVTVDSAGHVGEHTSLALDSSGNPVISYADSTNKALKVVHCGNATCNSGNVIQIVDSGQFTPWYTSLVLDSSGNPVISYYGDLDLKLVRCGNTTCSSGNVVQTLDSLLNTGVTSSLALDSRSNPIVSYFNSQSQDLLVMRCGNATCSSDNVIFVADSAGNVGSHTSLALDSSGNPIVSYFDATNGDLKVARVVDDTPVPPTPAVATWPVMAGGQYSSLALDSSGFPVISHYDYTNQDLKLAHCGNATCSAGNSLWTVDSGGNVGMHSSLALNSSGFPVISYWGASLGDLKLVYCGNANCTAGGGFQIVDSTGWVGSHTALKLDSSGKPVISYYDQTNSNLKLVHCGNATCSSGNTIQTVDSAGDVGQFTSLALHPSGNPVISYFDRTNIDLKLAHCGNATCTAGGAIVPVDGAGYIGQYTSLALDGGGNPMISYYDATNGDLKLVYCGNPTCTPAGGFQSLDRNGDVGEYTSLALNSYGRPIISYFDRTNFDLKVVYCGDMTCSKDNLIRTLDSVGDVGRYTSLKLDSNGNPVISYWDATNNMLKVAQFILNRYINLSVTASALAVSDTADAGADQPVDLDLVLMGPVVADTTAPDTTAPDTTAPDITAQSQRLFLPLVANNSATTAGDSAAVAPVSEATTQSAAVTTTAATTLTLTAVDPNTGVLIQAVTTTTPVSVPAVVEAAPVVTESAPVSVPVTVASAAVVTESAPAAVEAAPVVSESAPVSVPAAVEAAPVVTDTLLLTTTQPITTDTAAANPLAGTAVGNQGGIVVLALVGLAVVGSLVWQRRRSRTAR